MDSNNDLLDFAVSEPNSRNKVAYAGF